MPLKTFSVGDVLTAADVNDYLMEQAVITCTSATRPSSPVEGMTIYETDNDRLLTYSGSAWVVIATLGAWTSYSPTWSSSGTAPALGDGTLTGAYREIGATIHVRIKLTTGASSTYGTGVYSLSLPVAAKIDSLLSAYCIDASASSAKWAGVAQIIATSTGGDNMRIAVTDATSGVGATVPFTWASGDQLMIAGSYEKN